MDCRPIIEKLRKEQDAQMEELRYLLEHLDEESSAYLRAGFRAEVEISNFSESSSIVKWRSGSFVINDMIALTFSTCVL